MGRKVSDLIEVTTVEDADKIMISGASGSKAITWSSMADSFDFDALWEKMYINAKKVIISCSHCGSGNAITNGNCCQCGAPL